MVRITAVVLLALALAAAAPQGSTAGEPLPVAVAVGTGEVAPGGLVTVAVDVSAPPPGLGAYQLDVHYDRDALLPQSCQKTTGLCNKDYEPGVIRFSGISLDGKSGDFKLADVVFQSISAKETSVVLDLSVVVLASPAMVDLEPDAGISDGLVEVTETAPPASPPGDVNCDTALTMNDALDALLAVAGLGDAPCSSFGDANCDTRLDSGDVAVLLRWLAELPLALGETCPPPGELG